MFRHRIPIFTDYDKSNYIIQHNKLVIVSPAMKQYIKTLNYMKLTNIRLWYIHNILILKLCNSEPLPVEAVYIVSAASVRTNKQIHFRRKKLITNCQQRNLH